MSSSCPKCHSRSIRVVERDALAYETTHTCINCGDRVIVADVPENHLTREMDRNFTFPNRAARDAMASRVVSLREQGLRNTDIALELGLDTNTASVLYFLGLRLRTDQDQKVSAS